VYCDKNVIVEHINVDVLLLIYSDGLSLWPIREYSNN